MEHFFSTSTPAQRAPLGTLESTISRLINKLSAVSIERKKIAQNTDFIHSKALQRYWAYLYPP